MYVSLKVQRKCSVCVAKGHRVGKVKSEKGKEIENGKNVRVTITTILI
jgi:hypothetical protein